MQQFAASKKAPAPELTHFQQGLFATPARPLPRLTDAAMSHLYLDESLDLADVAARRRRATLGRRGAARRDGRRGCARASGSRSATAAASSCTAWSPRPGRASWPSRPTRSSSRSRPRPRITLVQALAKGDRDELAVQAATELGVDAIVPWAAARSVSRWEGPKAEKGRAALGRDRARGREAVDQVVAAAGRARRRRPPASPRRSTGSRMLLLEPTATTRADRARARRARPRARRRARGRHRPRRARAPDRRRRGARAARGIRAAHLDGGARRDRRAQRDTRAVVRHPSLRWEDDRSRCRADPLRAHRRA